MRVRLEIARCMRGEEYVPLVASKYGAFLPSFGGPMPFDLRQKPDLRLRKALPLRDHV